MLRDSLACKTINYVREVPIKSTTTLIMTTTQMLVSLGAQPPMGLYSSPIAYYSKIILRRYTCIRNKIVEINEVKSPQTVNKVRYDCSI